MHTWPSITCTAHAQHDACEGWEALQLHANHIRVISTVCTARAHHIRIEGLETHALHAMRYRHMRSMYSTTQVESWGLTSCTACPPHGQHIHSTYSTLQVWHKHHMYCMHGTCAAHTAYMQNTHEYSLMARAADVQYISSVHPHDSMHRTAYTAQRMSTR